MRPEPIHEAAHAVVGVCEGLEIEEVTAVPPQTKFRDEYYPPKTLHQPSKTERDFIDKHCTQTWAGIEAEHQTFGPGQPHGGSCDLGNIETFKKDYFPPGEGETWSAQRRRKCRELVKEHRDAIEEVAGELEKGRTLTHSEVKLIVEKHRA